VVGVEALVLGPMLRLFQRNMAHELPQVVQAVLNLFEALVIQVEALGVLIEASANSTRSPSMRSDTSVRSAVMPSRISRRISMVRSVAIFPSSKDIGCARCSQAAPPS